MSLNFYYARYKLEQSIKQLDKDLQKFSQNMVEDNKHDINIDIAMARTSLSEIKRCINNWYLGGTNGERD